MTEAGIDWRVVYESPAAPLCNEHALVLASRNIPHRVVHDAAGFVLLVPAAQSMDAVRELRLYADENPPAMPRAVTDAERSDALPGILAYLAVLFAVAWLAGRGAFGADWYAAGRIDGALIRDGEAWRLVTALTLHADLAHLAGNLVFGSFFGLLAGRLLGPGVAWLAILACAAAGNLVNTLLLASMHRSIGASTAVFAALGLVAGYVWHARLMSQERWVFRLGPIVGGIALLAYTGMGGGDADNHVDVGAHVMGFVCGFAGGMLLVPFGAQFRKRRVQAVAGAVACLFVAAAWALALR
ncbi:MAG TPA: rhomboid family intramembrane serine protease [Woeseiaceae bacterium]|nr:rhomboid family intramembrane serine protease [Woeseiaceae bacterium]